jgi:XTP/dITP diphosphohydrolase
VSRRFILATANPDKAAEIRDILASALGEVELTSRPKSIPEVDEVGRTLEENARLKALAIVEATGEAAVADDTGLEVDALGGAPGVLAARFAGEHATYSDNVTKLLGELDGVEPADRTARFRTVALVRYPDGTEVVASGVVEGTIALAPRGSEGFGYDPVFTPAGGDGRTFAEMSPVDKHGLSHRGRAFRALAAAIRGEAGT